MSHKLIVVFYHAECTDGFTAAWAAWKKFGNRADYVPIFHITPLPVGLKNREIYFLDIVPEMLELRRIMKANARVVVLDHHVTREKETKFASEYRYSLNHSGATLAWQYFFPGKPTPLFLKLVEEEDLWKFKTPHVREMLAGARLNTLTFANWDMVVASIEKPATRKQFIEQGETVLRYKNLLIAEMCRSANLVKFAGYTTYAVNAMVFKSEIGNLLSEKTLPPIAIIWSVHPDRISVSLRSNGTVDVAKIAEQYGGGGHKAAAGFNLAIGAKLPWKYIKSNRE